MSKRIILQRCLEIGVVLMWLWPAMAPAAQRTFVSAGSGSDSNPCTRPLPCRNFSAAILQTDANGEVVALDSGGYGAVSILQPVSLVAPAGVHAAITAFSGNAVLIFAAPSDLVILRGLYLSGLGGATGINFRAGGTVHVENCVVSGFTGAGIYSEAVGKQMHVKDTISRQNEHGFLFLSSGATVRANLDSIQAVENSEAGVVAGSNAQVMVTRSVAAGNADSGFATTSGSMSLESCTTAFNSAGVSTFSGTVRVAGCMITGNSNGVNTPLGAIISFGNNYLHGNTTNGSFTSTIGQQ